MTAQSDQTTPSAVSIMNDEQRLEARVGAALLQRGWTICTAESCTGGLVLHWLTNIPGSSGYVLGGVVAYANEIKEQVLGVPAATITAYGAVSEQTATAMLDGVLRLFPATLAVSITGIAGPGGGTLEKPVGLTYIGISIPHMGIKRVDRHMWDGDREAVKAASAAEALRKVLAVAG